MAKKMYIVEKRRGGGFNLCTTTSEGKPDFCICSFTYASEVSNMLHYVKDVRKALAETIQAQANK